MSETLYSAANRMRIPEATRMAVTTVYNFMSLFFWICATKVLTVLYCATQMMNGAFIVECAQENVNLQTTLITNVTHIVWN